MPRPPRLELPGVAHHVVQRGNNRGACFFGDADRRFYLKCLEEGAERRGCEVHAYGLMTNHVHLLITPAEAGALGAMMQDLGGRYVRVINRIHARTGTLWEARFRSSLIDSENYLLACQRYIELNPVRAGLAAHPGAYPSSSHSHYARGTLNRLIRENPVFRTLVTVRSSAARRTSPSSTNR
jgi:putative transposase